jgi:hypothetical protein
LNWIAIEKGDELIVLFLFRFDEFIQSFLFSGGDVVGEFTFLQFIEFEGKGDEGFFLISQFCSLFGLAAAGGGAEVFVEFFDFEKIEDLLGFEDAVLFEQEVGEVAIGLFDCC